MSEPAPVKRQVGYYGVNFGCDPELFLTKDGSVIGAEKAIPEAGLYNKHIVLDGVQVELNPYPDTCRALLANRIAAGFRTLRTHLATLDNITVSFRAVVDIDKKELDSLSEKAKVLGCMPSFNIYDSKAAVRVSGETYLKRSAGGHIHLGAARLKPYTKELVALLDVLLGNTCVLIDRDPDAPERRQVYGRAGEHRTPAHGIEYRTLSNFWLRAPELFSFVMGMSRLACSVLYTEKAASTPVYYSPAPPTWPAATELLKLVDLKLVEDAINRNDLELARENFNAIKPFLEEYVAFPSHSLGGSSTSLRSFDFFTKKIEEKGLEYWFPQDPMTAWCNLQDQHGHGWESFLMDAVYTEMQKVEAKAKVKI